MDEETRSVAGRILHVFGLAPQAPKLVRYFPSLRGSNNLAVVIRLLYRQVNEGMRFEPDSRAEPNMEQIEESLRQLDDCGDRVQEQIQ